MIILSAEQSKETTIEPLRWEATIRGYNAWGNQ